MKQLDNLIAERLRTKIFDKLFDKKNGTHEVDLTLDGVDYFVTGDWYKNEYSSGRRDFYEDKFTCTEVFSFEFELDERTYYNPSDLNFETKEEL